MSQKSKFTKFNIIIFAETKTCSHKDFFPTLNLVHSNRVPVETGTSHLACATHGNRHS